MPGPKGPQYRGEGIGGGTKGPQAGPDEEDVEGHGGAKGPQYRGEGIGGPGGRGRVEGDDEDVEGHSMEMRYRSPGSTGE
jgi:hypothetical protein